MQSSMSTDIYLVVHNFVSSRQNIPAKIFPPKYSRQNIPAKIFLPKYSRKIFPPKYSRQNISANIFVPKYSRQNIPSKINPPKYLSGPFVSYEKIKCCENDSGKFGLFKHLMKGQV
jgi:hypothetical protein